MDNMDRQAMLDEAYELIKEFETTIMNQEGDHPAALAVVNWLNRFEKENP